MQTEVVNTVSQKLAKVQASIKSLNKDADNPYFNSKYVTLDQALDYVLPKLSEAGLSLTQATYVEDDSIILTTTLSDGVAVVNSMWPVGKLTDTQQKLGSAMTYARRYTLMGLVGLSANDDDDAEATMDRPKVQQDKKPVQEKPKVFAPPAEVKPQTPKDQLFALVGLKGLKPERMKQILNAVCQKQNSKFLTDEECLAVIDYINKLV